MRKRVILLLRNRIASETLQCSYYCFLICYGVVEQLSQPCVAHTDKTETPVSIIRSSTIISHLIMSSLGYTAYIDCRLYGEFFCAVVWTEASDQRSRLPSPIWSLCYSSSYHWKDHRCRGKYMYILQPCVTDRIVGSIHRNLVRSSTLVSLISGFWSTWQSMCSPIWWNLDLRVNRK